MAGPSLPCRRPNSVVISNGFATMGIAVPGGLAAKLAQPERKVVAVSGDGGFLMNSQELETAHRLRLPYVNVVWTDRRYGVIELNQQRRFGRTFGVEFTNPDLVQYASSFGLPAWRVEQARRFRALAAPRPGHGCAHAHRGARRPYREQEVGRFDRRVSTGSSMRLALPDEPGGPACAARSTTNLHDRALNPASGGVYGSAAWRRGAGAR